MSSGWCQVKDKVVKARMVKSQTGAEERNAGTVRQERCCKELLWWRFRILHKSVQSRAMREAKVKME